MVKHFCDKCGKETNNQKNCTLKENSSYFDVDEHGTYTHIEKTDFDLCDECIEKVKESITGWERI